jgi:hypothetical protein
MYHRHKPLDQTRKNYQTFISAVKCLIASVVAVVDASGWESVASDESDSDGDSDSGNDDRHSDGGTANRMPAARVTQSKQKQANTRGHKKAAACKKKGASKPYSSAELVNFFNEVINAGNCACVYMFRSVFPEWCSAEPQGSAKSKEGLCNKIPLQY